MTEIGDFFVSAVQTVLSDEAKVYNYDDPGSFSELWGCGVFNSAEHKPIVIVWDARPRPVTSDDSAEARNGGENGAPRPVSAGTRGTKLLFAHLTPLDWALTFSIAAFGCDSVSQVSIHIVDLTGQDHDEWAFRWRGELLKRMPWVTLHAPLLPSASGEPADYRAGYRPILGERCEEPLLQCSGGEWTLTACATLESSKKPDAVDRLRELVEAWAATAVRTHDHHDLNNLAGPWILSGKK